VAALTDSRGTPGWYRKLQDPVPVANAGGGFLLGLLGYVVALNYIRGGREGVNAWLRAKFLNKVDAA